MSTLTTDQRWLLAHMGGWAIVDALLTPAGVDRLMQLSWGGVGGQPPAGGPEWLCSFETRAGKITAPWGSQPRVIVTSAQLKRFARDLPADICAELDQCSRARTTETLRSYQWCHCPWQFHGPTADSAPCDRYHPTAAEDQDHRNTVRRIAEWESNLLRRTLGIEAGQLSLFDTL